MAATATLKMIYKPDSTTNIHLFTDFNICKQIEFYSCHLKFESKEVTNFGWLWIVSLCYPVRAPMNRILFSMLVDD